MKHKVAGIVVLLLVSVFILSGCSSLKGLGSKFDLDLQYYYENYYDVYDYWVSVQP